MDFDAWLIAGGFTPADLTDTQRRTLQATWRASLNPPAIGPPLGAGAGGGFDVKLAELEAENDRIAYIREATLKALESHVGNQEKAKQLKDLCAAAVADRKVDKRSFDLSLLRLDRFDGPTVYAPSQPVVNDRVLEAAICVTHKLPGAEEAFDERTLDAAHKTFRRGVGLQELIVVAAERNSGYRGSARDLEPLCRAAFQSRDGHGFVAAGSGVGPSTLSVTGILSNVANKFMTAGFNFGEQSWREVSRIRTATDFKQMTVYRLTGANKFQKVAPGGEIKHGTLGELSYTNQVETYGILLGFDRQQLRNDDMGAFTGASDELGRGAIDSLNEVFYTEFLDDAAFFPTDKSLLNYDDGATDSVLSLAGLENADNLFASQTKPDGTPLGVLPAILFVPRALRPRAVNLMNGAITAAAQSTATVTVKNEWEQMFKVVSSLYLQSSAIAGSSSTGWYLLADPNNCAVIEVAFLDGVETPHIEFSEFDFNRLGMSARAYMDWGCNKAEYRGGVKLKGAA